MLPTPQRTAIVFSSARPTRERNSLQTEHESRRAEDWGRDCHHVEEESVLQDRPELTDLPPIQCNKRSIPWDDGVRKPCKRWLVAVSSHAAVFP
jgi:hypothetical protein